MTTAKATAAQAANATALRTYWHVPHDGGTLDMRAAVRAYLRHHLQWPAKQATIAELARRAGVGRKNADMCLASSYGRKYPGTRRALEVALGLAQYALDPLLDPQESPDAQ